MAQSMDNEKSDRRRLAELAITERVFKKSLTWMGVIASPLVIAAGIVGFQFNNVLQSAKTQVEVRTQTAISQIKTAEDYARSTIDRLRAVQKDLDDARNIVVQVRKLRSDVTSLQSQVEGFYKSQVRELFGGAQSAGRYSGTPGEWVINLQKQPIPASLIVRCGAIQLYAENYQLIDKKLIVKCELNLNPAGSNKADQDYIEVSYHPRN